ncbi:MAG: GNAT family N-acetyltransferase [Peptostreptococcaceae bacterium]
MEYKIKEMILKDGSKCILKSPNENDAKQLINYLKITSEETHFLIRYPEEIQITIEEEKEIIKDIKNSKDGVMIGVYIDNKLVGSAGIKNLGSHIKLKHRCTFGISIIKSCWNKGIGTILINEIINEAKQIGYEQIELGVFSDNIKAQRLYEKLGFEVWGREKNAYKLKDGTYCDNVIMGKLI